MLDGEFGLTNVVLGVPVHLGFNGMISVEEIALSENEKIALSAAADAIQKRLGLT